MRVPSWTCLSVLPLVLALAPSSRAQLLYEGNQSIPPWGGFSGSDFDVVSLQNGNLRLKVPVGSYEQRGGSTVTYTFQMDTPTYSRQTITTISNKQRIYITSIRGPFFHQGVYSNVGLWTLGSSTSTTTCAGNTVNYYNTWILTDPQGERHPLDLYTGGCTAGITRSNGKCQTFSDGNPLSMNAISAGQAEKQVGSKVFNDAKVESVPSRTELWRRAGNQDMRDHPVRYTVTVLSVGSMLLPLPAVMHGIMAVADILHSAHELSHTGNSSGAE
ncbi:MAG: hypothetical protein NVS9B14_09310 [Candidatus Acidiferrum sp.]